MRRSILLVLLGAFSTACGGTDAGGLSHGRGGATGAAPDEGADVAMPEDDGVAPAAGPCAGIAEPKAIAPDPDAVELRIADQAIFYRTGTKVIRVAKNDLSRAPIYESKDLMHAFVAGSGIIVAVEDPAPPTAVVRIVSTEDEASAITIPTNWNAGSSYVFAADDGAFYAVGDVSDVGEGVYQIPRLAPAPVALAPNQGVVSSPQLSASGDVWFVRDHQRIFEVELAAEPDILLRKASPAKEVFGIGYATCGLAVGKEAAFCSAGATLEQRDLDGGSPKTLLEAAKSKVGSPFGGATWHDGTLYVRSAEADASMGFTIRAIEPTASGASERIVACGRGKIGEMQIDGGELVWTEPGKGVFAAPR